MISAIIIYTALLKNPKCMLKVRFIVITVTALSPESLKTALFIPPHCYHKAYKGISLEKNKSKENEIISCIFLHVV